MRKFYLYCGTDKKISAGQAREAEACLSSCGVSENRSLAALKKSGIALYPAVTSGNSCKISPRAVNVVNADKNPDLITAVRACLTFEAEGVFIPFGANPNFCGGTAYAFPEVKKAVAELKRLSPLFGRILVL